jgi:hypothetical protein
MKIVQHNKLRNSSSTMRCILFCIRPTESIAWLIKTNGYLHHKIQVVDHIFDSEQTTSYIDFAKGLR